LNLDIRDEKFWHEEALKKELQREKQSLFIQRLAQSSEYEPIKQRVAQIDFRLEQLENPDAEDKKHDPDDGLPPLKERKIIIKGEE
jgi:hypothetical protein